MQKAAAFGARAAKREMKGKRIRAFDNNDDKSNKTSIFYCHSFHLCFCLCAPEGDFKAFFSLIIICWDRLKQDLKASRGCCVNSWIQSILWHACLSLFSLLETILISAGHRIDILTRQVVIIRQVSVKPRT
jgi:hypothetical protein